MVLQRKRKRERERERKRQRQTKQDRERQRKREREREREKLSINSCAYPDILRNQGGMKPCQYVISPLRPISVFPFSKTRKWGLTENGES